MFHIPKIARTYLVRKVNKNCHVKNLGHVVMNPLVHVPLVGNFLK